MKSRIAMEELKPIVCIICLDVKSDENCRVIDETTKAVLEFLLLKRPIEVNISMICKACLTKVVKAFRFKATCMDTENSIFPYVNSKNGSPANLKEIYMKEAGKKHSEGTLGDKKICRLCIQIISCGFTSVKNIEVDLICIYIPEVNFNSTEDPVVCSVCVDALKIHSNFLKSNCDILQKTENDDEDKTTENSVYIKTEEIYIKSEVNGDIERSLPGDGPSDCKTDGREDNKYHILRGGKAFGIGIYECDICNFKSKQKTCLVRHRVVHNNISDVQMYKCDKCNHESKDRSCLCRDQPKHKDISQVQMYMCDKCNFQTKYKRSLYFHELRHKAMSEVQMCKCDKCNSDTKHKGSQEHHQVLHTEARMYKCNTCNYRTKNKGLLKNHQLMHKDIPEAQTYKCDKCSFETKIRGSFVRHELKHKDVSEVQMYKCDHCNYGTIHKRNLISHLLVHREISEVQMYMCDKCNYKTKHKGSLVRHQLIHLENSKSFVHSCILQGLPSS